MLNNQIQYFRPIAKLLEKGSTTKIQIFGKKKPSSSPQEHKQSIPTEKAGIKIKKKKAIWPH